MSVRMPSMLCGHADARTVGRSQVLAGSGIAAENGCERSDKNREEVQLNLLLILPTAKRLNEPMSITVPTGVMDGTGVGGYVG